MLIKQSFPVNFSGDTDTKTDPFQVAPNNFLVFQNAVRTVGGQFKKRNGFDNIASFSAPYATSLATLNGGLVGVGSSIQAYSQDTGQIVNRGTFQPVDLSVIPAIRTGSSQTTVDLAIAPNGLACIVATDDAAGGIYQIIDSASGSVVVPVTIINSSIESTPRAWVLGSYFIIAFVADISGTETFQYIAIPYANPGSPGSPTTISTQVPSGGGIVYDGSVSLGILYLAWGSNDNTNASFRLNTLSSSLVLGVGIQMNSLIPDFLSVAVDSSGSSPVIWVSLVNYNSGTGKFEATTAAFNSSLVNILGNTVIFPSTTLVVDGLSITTLATGGVLSAYFSVKTPYSYDPSAPFTNAFTDVLYSGSCTQGGTVVTAAVFLRGVGLASKAFTNPINSITYMLSFYRGTFQPTYFLIDQSGNILSKLAYSNAGQGVAESVLCSVNQSGNTIQVGYLYHDQINSLNKSTSGAVGGIYAQSGVNIATFTLGTSDTVTSEIGGSLILSGGFPWMFDGQKPVEQNFHLYPEDIKALWSTSGGSIAALPDGSTTTNAYAYQVTYEWTDGAGNIHRSAPSVPVFVTTSGSGTSGSITLSIPTLRETAKVSINPVRIVVYRWSVENQSFYQVSNLYSTSSANPLTINDPTVDSITFTDTLADVSIIGDNLIYTTGGVVEDIAGPATKLMALFDTRLWLVDSEDPNLLWFSKQVIENTPVELSDLFTFYVAPTTSSQASTGPCTALAAMDDKLIIFKGNAAYYINGSGPDNTGANNQYSQPIFITGSVGCSNQKSIVLTPNGLMFQSNQGIWLLGRDLSTSYIGAGVEGFNSYAVTSALSIPETTQVRFTLNSGGELVYDYFYQKWDQCASVPAISSVLFQGLHTYLDSSGNIWQETSGAYEDGSTPVSLSFKTPWYNLAGLQGYERAYYFYFLGTYLSPHTLTIQVYYDYQTTNPQTVTITPDNAQTGSTLEQWRIFFKQQRCQSFQLVVTENAQGGAGLTISGLNIVYGGKKAYRPIPSKYSAGTS